MLRSIKNNQGVIGLTLSSIGLIIASGVILAAVFSFLYYSDFQRDSELKNIATGFSIMVEGMDTRFFENRTMYFFPDKDYHYDVDITSEYLIVNAKGTWWGHDLSYKERFLIKPWPRIDNINWVSGEQLHDYLKFLYGCSGEFIDPINKDDITDVKNLLNDEREFANKTLVVDPFYVDKHKPVFIEKVFIFYNSDGVDGWDKTVDERQEFILIYQNP